MAASPSFEVFGCRRGVGFPARVMGTFLGGWLLGLLVVLQLGRLYRLPGWMLVSGCGYLALMLVPIGTGIAFTHLAARLSRRGWGEGGGLLVLLGISALVGGLLFGT